MLLAARLKGCTVKLHYNAQQLRQLANWNLNSAHLRGAWNVQVRFSVCLKMDLRGLKERGLKFLWYHLFRRIMLVLVSTAHRLSEHREFDATDNFTTCHKTEEQDCNWQFLSKWFYFSGAKLCQGGRCSAALNNTPDLKCNTVLEKQLRKASSRTNCKRTRSILNNNLKLLFNCNFKIYCCHNSFLLVQYGNASTF